MSTVVVAKFGGSSLSNSMQFRKVKDIVFSDERRKYIIPSAPGKRSEDDYKITNLLCSCYECAKRDEDFQNLFNLIRERYKELCEELEVKVDTSGYLDILEEQIWNGVSLEYVASRGEYINGLVLAEYLNYRFIDPKDLIIFHKNGELNEELTYKGMKAKLDKIDKAVIPGFYGATLEGRVKTFSRGGSDITGSIVAKAIGASLYENWTDVSGLLMSDPKIVKNPKTIERVTYDELRELSYMGATVFHEEATFPVREEKIPIIIKNTNRPLDIGTIIVDEDKKAEEKYITGISGKKDFIVISIQKTMMSRDKGFRRKIISIFENRNIYFEHIPSAVDSISVVIHKSQVNEYIEDIIEEIKDKCEPKSISIEDKLALISVVGKGMMRNKDIISKILITLGKSNINIRMINQGASESSIVIGVENKDFETTIKAIYNAFENKID